MTRGNTSPEPEGYQMVLIFNPSALLDTFMMILLMMVISTMGILVLKWIAYLTYNYIYNLRRKKEVINNCF
jgi:arginine exporter protein ArgO